MWVSAPLRPLSRLYNVRRRVPGRKTAWTVSPQQNLNTLRPTQNGRHIADDTFKRIFVNENVRILIEISLKFVPKGPINNIPALVQIMVWCRPGDKPLSEPMMVSSLTHICVTRPQLVNHADCFYYQWRLAIKTRPDHWMLSLQWRSYHFNGTLKWVPWRLNQRQLNCLFNRFPKLT